MISTLMVFGFRHCTSDCSGSFLTLGFSHPRLASLQADWPSPFMMLLTGASGELGLGEDSYEGEIDSFQRGLSGSTG